MTSISQTVYKKTLNDHALDRKAFKIRDCITPFLLPANEALEPWWGQRPNNFIRKRKFPVRTVRVSVCKCHLYQKLLQQDEMQCHILWGQILILNLWRPKRTKHTPTSAALESTSGFYLRANISLHSLLSWPMLQKKQNEDGETRKNLETLSFTAPFQNVLIETLVKFHQFMDERMVEASIRMHWLKRTTRTSFHFQLIDLQCRPQ